MRKRSERTQKVDCQQVDTWLIAYLKGGLSPTRRQAMEDHLATCDACARSVQQTQILESELRLQAARHNPTLSAKASARIHERVYGRMRRGLVMQRTVKLVGVAAVVVVIAVLAGGAMALWQGRQSEIAIEQDVTPEVSEPTPTLVPPTPVPATSVPATSVPVTDTPVPPENTAEPSPTEVVPPAETDVPEPTALPSPTDAEPAAEYQTYTIGEDMRWGLLTLAHLNGDAYPDIAVTDGDAGVLRLLFNQGDGTFEEAPEMATGDSPYGVTVADLDGDGDADLVVSHSPYGDPPGHFSVNLNNGDGTFQEQVDYATGGSMYSSALDVDGDGDLDLVIANVTAGEEQEKEGAAVWLNDGDGTFEEGNHYGFDSTIVRVATGDLNGDTYPDLVIRHSPDPKVSIQLGHGDGSFAEPVEYETARNLQWLTVADLDGDADPDVATGSAHGVVTVLLNNGDGTFQDKVDYDVGGDIMDISAVDMDGDGALDLLFAASGKGNLGLLANHGDGTFELTKEYYWKGIWITLFGVSDVDGDGRLDLVGVDSDSVYVIPLEDSG